MMGRTLTGRRVVAGNGRGRAAGSGHRAARRGARLELRPSTATLRDDPGNIHIQ